MRSFKWIRHFVWQHDSTVLWGEIIAPGREKRGEIFDYESFRSNFKIYVDDELIAFDSLHFSPREMDLGGIGVLEGAMYIGSVWLVSPNIEDVDIRALQETITSGRRTPSEYDEA